MKKLIISALFAASLAGCAAIGGPAGSASAPTAAQQLATAQQARNAACQVWLVTFQAALAARKANVASPTLVQQISLADTQFTPVCTGPLPSTVADANNQTVQVMTSMATLELLLKDLKK